MSKLENPEILVVDDDLEAAQAFADLLMAKIKIGDVYNDIISELNTEV